MTNEQRKRWEEMLEHQQAVTRACNYWAGTRHIKTWCLLNEAANRMLQEMCDYAELCK